MGADKNQMRCMRQLFQFACQLQTAGAWHMHIQKQNIKRLFVQQGDGLQGIACLAYFQIRQTGEIQRFRRRLRLVLC